MSSSPLATESTGAPEASLQATVAQIQAAAAAANVTLPASLMKSLQTTLDLNTLQSYLQSMGLNIALPTDFNKETNDEEDDAAEAVSYKPYRPLKVKFGRPHPDPVVENSTLAAVEPPEIVYNLAIPADVIAGKN